MCSRKHVPVEAGAGSLNRTIHVSHPAGVEARGRRRGLPAPVRGLPARYWMVIPSFSVRDLKALYCFSTNALVSSGPWI